MKGISYWIIVFLQGVGVILAGRADYETFQYLALFNPDFTFNLCIVPDLDALNRLMLQYITPAYILLLLCGVLVLTRIKGLSKYLGKHSFLHALWFLVFISYLNIANTSFELIHCRTIGPTDGGTREYVLVHDPSIVCYEGRHLFYAIIAILLDVSFVIPFPAYLLALTYFPKMKPITDVYSRHYRSKILTWIWVVWNIGRRLLLVVVGVFVEDFIYRHFALLIVGLAILLMQVISRPYLNIIDNFIGFISTFLLVLIAVVTQPNIYIFVDPHRAVSASFVISVIILGGALIILEIVLRLLHLGSVGKWLKEKLLPMIVMWKDVVMVRIRQLRTKKYDTQELVESTSIIPKFNTADATTYREPLLDSYFGGSSGSSINSSSFNKRRKKHQMDRGSATKGARPPVRPTVTVVSQDRESGDSESGFASVSAFANYV